MILFGTLGFTANKLLPSIKKASNLSKVVLFYDRAPRSAKAREEVATYCNGIGLEVESIELDAFDLISDAIRIRQELGKYAHGEVICNLTGGTGILTSAALLACVLTGVRCVYIREGSEDEIQLPLLEMRYDRYINARQRRILQSIQTLGGECTQSQIVKETKSSKPNVNHHITNLSDLGLIEVRANPEDKRKKIVRLAPSTALLLMEQSG